MYIVYIIIYIVYIYIYIGIWMFRYIRRTRCTSVQSSGLGESIPGWRPSREVLRPNTQMPSWESLALTPALWRLLWRPGTSFGVLAVEDPQKHMGVAWIGMNSKWFVSSKPLFVVVYMLNGHKTNKLPRKPETHGFQPKKTSRGFDQWTWVDQ